MNLQKEQKINQLLQWWKPHTVLTQKWLEEKNYSRQLLRLYTKSHWLEKIGTGAYVRTGDAVSWEGGLYTLQNQLNLPIHIGGKIALQLLGKGHFIALMPEKQIIELHSHGINKRIIVPKWFLNQKWSNTVQIHHSCHFIDNKIGLQSEKIIDHSFSLTISSPERAILEFLVNVPEVSSLEEGFYLMEGLISLRPELVQQLLVCCSSIKAKRLFLLLAEHFNYPWFEMLDLSTIPLGKGKRKIGTGGQYYPKYLVSIPPLPDGNINEEDIP
jgi:hypothetical protein